MMLPDSDRNPHLKPFRIASAAQYFAAYYPDDDDHVIKEKFKPFELLSVNDILAMFPAMEQTIKEYNKKTKVH